MKVTSVEAIPVKILLAEPLHWGTGYMEYAEHVLVRVNTDEGLEGLGEAVPRPGIYGETQPSVTHMVANVLGPMLIGLDPAETEKVWAKMNTVYWNPTAKGAIDVALYDLMGKKWQVPCYKMLGGWTNKVRATWMLGLKSMDKMVKDAGQKYSEGFRCFKLKGGQDVDFDIEMVRNVRKVVGDSKLYIDSNQAYGYMDMIKIFKAIGDELVWLEEPMRWTDSAGRKKYADHFDLPILGDESLFTIPDVLNELRLGYLDIIMVKIPRTGFTLGKKYVALAEAYNKPMVIGSQAETTLGTTACLHFAAAHKQFSLYNEVSYYMSIKGNPLTQELECQDGYLTVPEGPGLGVELDEEKVAYFNKLALDS